MKLISHVQEDIRVCDSVKFRNLTDNVFWQSCNILAFFVLIILIIIRDFRVAFCVVNFVLLVFALQKLSESLKIISTFMPCFVFVFAFLHKLLSCRQIEQLTRWCLSSQRKHFRNWWCNWSLLKSEKCLWWWLILRLFCSQSIRLCSFLCLTYSAIFIVFNCAFFSCSFWSSLSTFDLFCASMTSQMIMYSSDSNLSKTWKRRSDLNRLLMSFCVMMIFQVSLTRCVHVFSIEIFINIL